jgi:hypothetical protein
MVGTNRRDQLQFLHVEIGVAPQQLAAFAATQQPFEQASLRRNYYVVDALARDDHARQVFALSLAGGVIAVQGGAFAFIDPNDRAVELGETVDDALELFGQRADLVKAAEDRINGLPLAVAAQRMEIYLTRGRSIQDEMWWEFASYVRDRLGLVQHQQIFASEQHEEQMEG